MCNKTYYTHIMHMFYATNTIHSCKVLINIQVLYFHKSFYIPRQLYVLILISDYYNQLLILSILLCQLIKNLRGEKNRKERKGKDFHFKR